ncbi:HEPN domain-containing protein [Ferrimonas balearica]|uniref:HEPN domain-containing protein n=1 Tax=Ferrimonas balearica TaxID=44012 RepID=UPI001C9797E2|nr:HEPN domain-containing protein [Ferrimonas balearica]MBY6223567.1 HEPN domain-containing protein [Ferrimonas balearica]
MDSTDFLLSAKDLAKGSKEVDYRNSVSRAYYASYHACQEFVINKGLLSRDYCTHEGVSKVLRESKTPGYAALGEKLHQAKVARHRADYRLLQSVRQIDAKQQIKKVENILSALNGLSTSAAC